MDMAPILIIAADGQKFDSEIVQHWREEGFNVRMLPFEGDRSEYLESVELLADVAEDGFAVVAYDNAASMWLETLETNKRHLKALVAYYPASLPSSGAARKPSIPIVVHLAASQGFAPAYRSYSYADTVPSFAERDSSAYNKVAASLAWSRSLEVVRKGFDIHVDLESIWENHVALEFATKDAAATMKTMIAEPYVNHIPTLTGGIGHDELFRFYRDFFIPGNPPSLTTKLISRTIGTDRVVDEMLISFRHTQEIPWMLPDVPPTDCQVDVIVVGIICIRGGKLYHEHLHWDQASVLVQIGLLDPKLVPQSFKDRGMKRLPVYGAETAAKVVDESSLPSNDLISGWKIEGGLTKTDSVRT